MKAAFIGRFQPFHQGHRNVVDEYQNEYDDLCIVIGSAGEKDTEDNPLSFEERKEVIHECFPDIEIFGVEDEETDEDGNRTWIGKIEEKTGADAVISQNDLVKEIVRNYSDMELETQKLHDPKVYSGTAVRRRMKSGEEWRYLTPECAKDKLEELEEKIRESGIDYDFEPGWKKENSFYGTAEK